MLVKISGQDRFRNWLEKAELDCQRTLNSLLLEPIQVHTRNNWHQSSHIIITNTYITVLAESTEI